MSAIALKSRALCFFSVRKFYFGRETDILLNYHGRYPTWEEFRRIYRASNALAARWMEVNYKTAAAGR